MRGWWRRRGATISRRELLLWKAKKGWQKSGNVQSAILMHRLFLSSAIIRMNAGSGRTMESSAAILMQALLQRR